MKIIQSSFLSGLFPRSFLRNEFSRISCCGNLAALQMQQVRHLNLHEYQSKKLMESYKVNTQRFRVVDSSAQVATVMKEVSWDEYVIKAQVHAGGRGKGVFDNGFQGGVHLTKE
eukprot:Sdes_comp20015_c0_seq4m12707